jgi:hypothetical protein
MSRRTKEKYMTGDELERWDDDSRWWNDDWEEQPPDRREGTSPTSARLSKTARRASFSTSLQATD